MSRYEVVFSARALESLRRVTRYIADVGGDMVSSLASSEDLRRKLERRMG